MWRHHNEQKLQLVSNCAWVATHRCFHAINFEKKCVVALASCIFGARNTECCNRMGLSVDLDPDTSVVFTGDFCSSTITTLSIKNLDVDNSIVFKIKTNAPQRYVVKPHKGSIGPSDTVTVVMTLLPFNFKETEKYPDKFLIQVKRISIQSLLHV